MPLNDFFTYQIESKHADTIKAIVSINARHPLYKGHFPGQPVTPGVVLIEIIRQVLSGMLHKKLIFSAAKEIKFIAAVIPTEITEIKLTIEYKQSPEGIEANCVFSGNEQIFTKLKGEFREE
jgi:3-hydroxyacyl-[acyl-carrier-protein] dehydratase